MSEGDYEEGQPRRLHPVMTLIGAVRSGFSNFAALVPAILIGVREGLGVFFIVIGVVLGFALVAAVLRWWRFTYRIGDDEVVIDQGVLRRSHRSIPFDRIQDVSIEQKLLHRLLGVVIVKIETGGSVKDEGVLDCVSVAEARRLRATLRPGTRPVVVEAGVEPRTEAAPAEELVFSMSLGRLLLFGALSFSLLWMAALGGLLQFVDDVADFKWRDVMRWLDLAGHEAAARFGVSLVLTVIGALLLLGFLSGLASTVLRDFGFRLMRSGGRFRRVRGLLTRSEVSISIRRIQLGLVERKLIKGAMGFAAFKVQSLGGSDDRGGRQDLAPFAKADEITRVVAATGLPVFEEPGLKPVAVGHVVRALLTKAVPFLLAVIAAAIILTPWAWWGLLSAPVIVAVSLLVRRFHRYAIRDTSFQVMRGVLRRCEWTVPYGSIQVVSIQQTLLQRWLGIATVGVDTAGASGHARPNVEDAHVDDAIALTRELIARA